MDMSHGKKDDRGRPAGRKAASGHKRPNGRNREGSAGGAAPTSGVCVESGRLQERGQSGSHAGMEGPHEHESAKGVQTGGGDLAGTPGVPGKEMVGGSGQKTRIKDMKTLVTANQKGLSLIHI